MADIIFIYAEEDGGRVRDICAALRQAGLDCDADRSIPAGQTYAGHMSQRLAAAKAVVMCWSAASLAQPRLIDEAAAARDAGKLAPASLDGTLPPLGFGQIQTANLADWPGSSARAALDTLAAAIAALRGGPGPAPKKARPRGPGRPFIWTWKFWGLSLLAAAAIGALLFLSPEGRAEMQRTGESLAGRLETLGAFAVLAFLFTPLSRALLHGSRRIVGLESRAFFNAEYLMVVLVSLLIAAGIYAYRVNIDDDPSAPRFSLLTTLGAGATVFPLLLALAMFVLRALRRLILGRVAAP